MLGEKEVLSLKAEALRLMGFGGQAPDIRSSLMLDEVLAALEASADFRCVSLRCDITVCGSAVDFGVMGFESQSLAKHLHGCKEGYLFAATLGAGPDRLLGRYERMDISRANALQAAAAALLEQRADEAQAALAGELAGLYLTDRFSPGYGDLALSCQKRFLEVMDTGRRIGLSCTEHAMLTPTKSITALIGIREGACEKSADRCAACKKADCVYRREKA